MTEITVLLATRNGERVLPRTLEGYILQRDVPFEWKLVVVDNGSTDQTSEVIKRFRNRLNIEPLFEPIAGKNRALNAGLQAIDSDVVIISDDDAIPQPDFLVAWQRAFSNQPSYDIFGGSIEPLFDIEPPEWMSRSRIRFAELFTARDLPEGPVGPYSIFGPNMAVRRSVFVQGLKFAEWIGPDGTDANYPMGSETEFCARASQHGHKTWFAREPLVWHIVRSHQLRPSYWYQRAYRLGRGQARMYWSNGTPISQFGYSKAALTAGNAYQICRQYLLWCRTLTLIPDARLDAMWNYHWNRGFHDEHVKRRKIFLSSQVE